jgi:hypothetical protein
MKQLATAILCAAASFAAADAALAQSERTLLDPIGLPLGSGPNGLTTSVAFLAPCPRGQFSGIVIDGLIPETSRIRIQEQWGTSPPGRVLYDGSVRTGQFIPFTHVRIIWTGWKSGYGNHMTGIRVRGVCLAQRGATPGPPSGANPPPPGAADDQFCRALYARADAENRAGNQARDRGDLAGARSRYNQALALFRQGADDPRCTRFRGQFINAVAIVERNVVRVSQAPTGRRVFDSPTMNGAIVDQCVTWATNCGDGGANLFCQRMGMHRAVSWIGSRPGRTWIMGENRFCKGSYCGGFAQIVCE